MQDWLLEYLRCPFTRKSFKIDIINIQERTFNDGTLNVITEAILFSDENWFYPVINGIPRLAIDSFLDYEQFLRKNLSNYEERKQQLLNQYGSIIQSVRHQNKKTKTAFTKEWSFYNFEEDKTWNADASGMIERFLKETDETFNSLKEKIIFDAGCGNGRLNILLGENNIRNIGIDLSSHVDKCHERNNWTQTAFIEGDIQFPPVLFQGFDIVHCSGVLIHTKNPELSFSCIEPLTKNNGKLSVWLYHPRKNRLHNFFNIIREFTSKLPINIQLLFYSISIFPISYLVKRMKGNRQNKREMMLQIFDWFSPEFRWEVQLEEGITWFSKRNYTEIQQTTTDLFGYNLIGKKSNKC